MLINVISTEIMKYLEELQRPFMVYAALIKEF